MSIFPIANIYFVIVIAIASTAATILTIKITDKRYKRLWDIITKRSKQILLVFSVVVILLIAQECNTNLLNEIKDSKIDSLNKLQLSKSKYIQDFLTGEDRYAFLNLRYMPAANTKEHYILLTLQNLFDLPIFDVTAQLYNYNYMDTKKFKRDGDTSYFIKMADHLRSQIFEASENTLAGNQYKAYLEPKLLAKEGKLVAKSCKAKDRDDCLWH